MSIEEVSSAGTSYLAFQDQTVKILKHSHQNHQNTFAFSTADYENRSWLKSIIDSSHLITFFISISVIIYGSFKSLNLDYNGPTQSSLKLNELEADNEDEDRDEDDENEYSFFLTDDSNTSHTNMNNHMYSNKKNKNQTVQTIDTLQALFIPFIASISLLLMFFFFESIQTVFVICTSILAVIAFSYLLSPVCKIILKSIFTNHEIINKKRTSCLLGKHRLPDLVSFIISSILVILWIITGHWLLMDIIGVGFCVTFIAIVRLPSLKVSILLLVGLVIYDVLWVYFSHLIFSSNVMVKVATKEAENPFGMLARKLNFKIKDSPKLSLPGKLVIPSYQRTGNFSILGLGDIVVPGLLLCFVLRFDAYKRNQLYQAIISDNNNILNNKNDHTNNCDCLNCKFNSEKLIKINKKKIDCQINSENNKYKTKFRRYLSYPLMLTNMIKINLSNNKSQESSSYSFKNLIRFSKLSYFHCSLIGYFVGLLTATLSSEVFREAQPALLFLVPFTLLPLLIMAYLKGDLHLMWNEPFSYKQTKYFYV